MQNGLTSAVLFQCVPDIAVEIIIASKQQATALRESHRRDATDDVVVGVHPDLLVGTNVKQQASRIVRPSRKCKSTRKVLCTASHSSLYSASLQEYFRGDAISIVTLVCSNYSRRLAWEYVGNIS